MGEGIKIKFLLPSLREEIKIKFPPSSFKEEGDKNNLIPPPFTGGGEGEGDKAPHLNPPSKMGEE